MKQKHTRGFLSILLTTAMIAVLLTAMPARVLAASDYSTSDYAFVAATGTLTVKTNAGSNGWRTTGTAYFGPDDIKSVVINSGVTRINGSSFADCSNLTGTLTIPSSVTTIANNAFIRTGITTLILPASGSLTIGASVFYACYSLTGTLTIPSSVTDIGVNAFSYTGITSLSLPATGSLTISSNAFTQCTNLASTLVIPGGVASLSRNAFIELEGVIHAYVFTGATPPSMTDQIRAGDAPSYYPAGWSLPLPAGMPLPAYPYSGAMPAAPAITTISLPAGKEGVAYSWTLEATGTGVESGSVKWSLSSGTLPGGLSLDSETGVISGTPPAAGTATIDVKASNGLTPDATKTFVLVVRGADPVSSAAVTVTAPATGNTPATAAPAGGAGYACSPVTWSPGDSPFQGSTQYTASVTLTAEGGFTFPAGFTATINSNAATVTGASGNTVTVSYQFPATAAANLGNQTIVITAPVTGATPQTAVAGGTGYSGTSIAWSGSPATFAPSTVYTATVVLASTTGYKWPATAPTITVAGGTISNRVVSGGDVSGNKLTFDVTFPATLNNAKAITSFTLAGVAGTINETAGTIAIMVPYGTDITNLTPTIVHTGASISPTTAQNFSSAVTYTVTAENSTTKNYIVTVTVDIPYADLAIIKTVNDATPAVGDNVTFTLTLINNGPDGATGVQVTDLLPSGLSFVSATPVTAYNQSTGVWNIGTISSGLSETLDIVTTVTSLTTITNEASITSATSDPDLTNNTVSVIIMPVKASPTLSLSASPASPVTYGNNVTLTATLSGAAPNNNNKTITFTVNGTSQTATTNASGIATYILTSPNVGTNNFGASFASDASNNAATATNITGYVVNQAPITVTARDGVSTFGESPTNPGFYASG